MHYAHTHNHTFLHIYEQFSVSNPLSSMFLEVEEPDNLEETHLG